MARTPEAPETMAAYESVLDDLAMAGGVERAVWFGTPAAKVDGKIFLCVWRGRLVARIGREEVDLRVAAGAGERFDPSGRGMAMKDWLESHDEPSAWTELALEALAFTTSGDA